MKTIKNLVESHKEWGKMPIGTPIRVNNAAAKRLVDNKEAVYIPKSEWKKLRDRKQQETNKEANNA